MGFSRIEGIDISARLLADYGGPAQCYVGDCRQLPFADGSRDVLIVQGGLHHLPDLPCDLPRVLQECRRVLVDGGLMAVVEPWPTPFLDFVHFVCRRDWARRLNGRVDALATMIDHERETYEAWLRQPEWILSELTARFRPRTTWQRWGKLFFLAEKRRAASRPAN